MRKPVTPRIDDAAGITQFTTVPAGAMMVSGRNMPAVFGMSSRITARTQSATTDAMNERVRC